MHQNKNKNPISAAKTAEVRHEPVLLAEVLKYLDPEAGERYLDLTAGYGGHAAAVLEKTSKQGRSVLVDRDQEAAAYLKERWPGARLEIRHADFLSASQELASEGRQFDLILADLGLSSLHLNQSDRGFAFSKIGRAHV